MQPHLPLLFNDNNHCGDGDGNFGDDNNSNGDFSSVHFHNAGSQILKSSSINGTAFNNKGNDHQRLDFFDAFDSSLAPSNNDNSNNDNDSSEFYFKIDFGLGNCSQKTQHDDDNNSSNSKSDNDNNGDSDGDSDTLQLFGRKDNDWTFDDDDDDDDDAQYTGKNDAEADEEVSPSLLDNDQNPNQQKVLTDEEIETMVAKELSQLSSQERNQVFYDIHGVSDVVHETPEFVAQKLHELDRRLNKLSDGTFYGKSIYLEAKRLSETFVSCQKLRLQFLRSVRFDPKAAAAKMDAFFEQKKFLFGREKLVKHITMDDLNEAEVTMVESGIVQILPIRDQGGRFITWGQATEIWKYPSKSVLRIYYYILMAALDDEENQKRGMVKIAYNVGKDRCNDHNLLRKLGNLLMAVPMRNVASHLCHDNRMFQGIVTFAKYVMARESRMRFRDHYGSCKDIIASLQTFGIPRFALPIDDNGTKLTENHNIWLQNIKMAESNQQIQSDDTNNEKCEKNENINKQKNNQDQQQTTTTTTAVTSTTTAAAAAAAQKVLLPRYNDVLFGRGKNIMDHPGNLRFHRILEIYEERYHRSEKFDKTAISQMIVDIVKKSDGRFLRLDNNSKCWIEVVELEEARDSSGIKIR